MISRRSYEFLPIAKEPRLRGIRQLGCDKGGKHDAPERYWPSASLAQ